MNVVIAIDSFKGSLTSMEAGKSAADGIKKVFSDAEIAVCPLADGGEGTVEALTTGCGGIFTEVTVTGPLGKPVIAFSGCVTKEAYTCNAAGIDAFFPIQRGAVSLADAMNKKNAAENLCDTVEQVFRLIRTFSV